MENGMAFIRNKLSYALDILLLVILFSLLVHMLASCNTANNSEKLNNGIIDTLDNNSFCVGGGTLYDISGNTFRCIYSFTDVNTSITTVTIFKCWHDKPNNTNHCFEESSETFSTEPM